MLLLRLCWSKMPMTRKPKAQRSHPHAQAIYRVISGGGGAFAVEVSIPESYPAIPAGITMMVNGNYNGWRLEDAWL
jgi:hypothetical protein